VLECAGVEHVELYLWPDRLLWAGPCHAYQLGPRSPRAGALGLSGFASIKGFDPWAPENAGAVYKVVFVSRGGEARAYRLHSKERSGSWSGANLTVFLPAEAPAV
jgi:hypothetical protein